MRAFPTLKRRNLAPGKPAPYYFPEGAAAVFSGAGAALSGVAPSRVRNGKNGVTSKGIFSAAVVIATGFVLINSS